MKQAVICPRCAKETPVDTRREFSEVMCQHCGMRINMNSLRKVRSTWQMRNKDLPAKHMGNPGIKSGDPLGPKRVARDKRLIAESFEAWDKKIVLVQSEDARAWLASLLWWQLYSEVSEICEETRKRWRGYIDHGAGEISVDEFLREISVVGMDRRVLTMQCRGCVSFPEHLKP